MKAFVQAHAPLISHEAAGKRCLITGTLILEQPLHIGSGHGSAVTDSAVIRDHAGRPVIPGSSLRGALRNRCERLADALLPGQICFLYDPDGVRQVDCVSVKPELLRDKSGDLLADKELWARLSNYLCPSCRLFGASAYWASKVRIPDLPMIAPAAAEQATEVRHGVGIHRDTQTTAPRIKYDQEVVTANARFKLDIIVENPDDDDLSLLALGLADLAAGRMTLGGNTTRGLGGCRIEAGQVQWVDLGQRKQLVEYLTKGAWPAANRQTLQDWLKTQLQRWTEG
jgi:CRISPR-associated RAMP protein (TIGR02581 family)